jgi:hypothetical protein
MRPILSADAGVLAPRPLILVVMVLSLAAGQAAGAAPTPVSVAISKVGSTSPASAPYATDADGQNEIDLALNGDADGTGGTGGFAARSTRRHAPNPILSWACTSTD